MSAAGACPRAAPRSRGWPPAPSRQLPSALGFPPGPHPHLALGVHESLASRACNVVSSWFHPADWRGERRVLSSACVPGGGALRALGSGGAWPDSHFWLSEARPAGGARRKGTMLVQVRERVSGVQGAPQGTCSHWAAKARGGCSEEWRGARRDGRAHPWGAGGGNFEGSGPLCSSATQSCLTPCNPMDCSTPGLPVHHQLLELTQTHVHRVGDAIQASHPPLSPSSTALNLSQHQGLSR